jgi:hypothetical protein
VLATADDAMERVKMPEPLRQPDAAAADSPTSEVELDVLPGGAEGTDELEVSAAAEPTEGEPPPEQAEPLPEGAEPVEEDPLADSRRTSPGGE